MNRLTVLFLFILLSLVSNQLLATHLQGGYIQFKPSPIGGLTQQISVFLLYDTRSNIPPGGGNISFGDGTTVSLIDNASAPIVTFLNDKYSLFAYEISYTFAAPGSYTISYTESNRNTGMNASALEETPFYIETILLLDSFLGTNSSPIVGNILYSTTPAGTILLYNPTVFDEDGDSISYHLAIPMQETGTEVFNYRSLNDPEFYPEGFATANENGTAPPTFSLSPFDGNLIWDTPGLAGEYIVVLKIKEWRSVNGEVFNLSSINYDMLIPVDERVDDLIKPEIIIPGSQCYNDNVAESLRVESNGTPMKVEVFTDALNAKLDGSPFKDYSFSDDFSTDNFNASYSLNSEEANHEYHQVTVKVTQEAQNGNLYSWTAGFVFGFGCETIVRTITTIRQKDKQKVYSYYNNGSIFIKALKPSTELNTVLVYNPSGKLALKTEAKYLNGQMELSIPQLKSGLYIIAVESKSIVYKDKLIVNN